MELPKLFDSIDQLDTTCPFCGGTGTLPFQDLSKEQLAEVTASAKKDKWDLKTKTLDLYYDTTFNHLETKLPLAEQSYFCPQCSGEGYLEIYSLYGYETYAEYNEANRKKAVDNGMALLYSEDDDVCYLFLMACGMDLGDVILTTYLEINGSIPAELAKLWNQSYPYSVSKEQFAKVTKACQKAIKYEIEELAHLEQAMLTSIKDPEYVKQVQEQRLKEFNESLEQAKNCKDKTLGSLLLMNKFISTTGLIVKPKEEE